MTRRYAFALVLALFAGLLLIIPSAQDAPDSPAVTVATDVAHQPGAAPKPHNDTSAYVHHGQLPADAPPVVGRSLSLRVIMSAAKRMHRTPDEVHTPRHGDRAPPRPSGS